MMEAFENRKFWDHSNIMKVENNISDIDVKRKGIYYAYISPYDHYDSGDTLNKYMILQLSSRFFFHVLRRAQSHFSYSDGKHYVVARTASRLLDIFAMICYKRKIVKHVDINLQQRDFHWGK